MNKQPEFVNNYFASIYLTIIAFLQGAAIFQLTPYLVSFFTTESSHFTDTSTAALILTLAIIVTVWHHYVNGVLFLRWFPNIIDALIPFGISITEFLLISFLEKKGQLPVMNIYGWTLAFLGFLLIGSVAYFAAAIRNDAQLITNFLNNESAALHGKNIRRFYIQAGISMTGQALFTILILIIHSESLLWFCLMFFIVHIVISEYLHLKHILPLFKKGLRNFELEEELKKNP